MPSSPTPEPIWGVTAVWPGYELYSPEPEAFNIWIMDVDARIKAEGLLPVTSQAIHEPSSPDFHPDGLFSERIFGQVGTPMRLVTFGYLDLNTTIIAPIVYKNLVKLSAFYEEIMAGKAYAVFDPLVKDFKRVLGDPEATPAADTGFSFFLKHFPELEFHATESTTRQNRVALITKYRRQALYQRYLVQPAGLRDIQVADGRLSQDDINKLYLQLMALANAIPPGTTSTLFDAVRYNVQKKAVEIYEYLENFMTGKRGFLQGAYGRRRIALGTRNVITAASYATLTPDDPQAIRPDETKIGLFQTMKGLQPAVVYHIRTALVDPVFGSGDVAAVPLTDPATLQLTYVEVAAKERARFTKTEGIYGWINRFKNADVRNLPITVSAVTGKPYYLCLVYDTGDEVALFRSLTDLEAAFADRPVDRSKIRPLTWIEALYMVTALAADGCHVFITRYPVTGSESCYPTKIHVTTTQPARVVRIRDLLTDTLGRQYPQYPQLGMPFCDSVTVHASRLPGLGADGK